MLHYFADTVGTLALETSQIDDIGTASIQLVDEETGTVLTTAPLYRCSNRLLATVSFPNVTVNYVVVGNDINGRPFTTPLYRSARFVSEADENIQETTNGTLDRDETTNGTLDRDESTNSTLDRDETTNGTLDHEETTNGTLDREETTNGTLDREETTNGTLDRDETTNSTLDRDETTNGTLDSDETTNGTLDRDETTNGTLDRDETTSSTLDHDETFLVVMEGDTFVEVQQDQIISIVVRVYNKHAANYTFTAQPVTGFRQAFRPTSLEVPPGESRSVYMVILRETAEPGSNYTFTATVSDGYSSQSVSKTVLIVLPVSKKLGYNLVH